MERRIAWDKNAAIEDKRATEAKLAIAKEARDTERRLEAAEKQAVATAELATEASSRRSKAHKAHKGEGGS